MPRFSSEAGVSGLAFTGAQAADRCPGEVVVVPLALR